MEIVRTPDACFENLPGYPFEPHYSEVPDGEGGIYGLHLTDLSLGGGLRDILASTMCGRLYVLRFEPIPAPGSVSLLGSYQFLAPGLGAYNAIQSLPNPGAFGGQGGTRVILCSANGIHALDLPRVSTGLLLTSSHDSISASAGGSERSGKPGADSPQSGGDAERRASRRSSRRKSSTASRRRSTGGVAAACGDGAERLTAAIAELAFLAKALEE